MKAFLVNRVGDFGFILGIGLILASTGTMDYQEAFGQAENILAQNFSGTHGTNRGMNQGWKPRPSSPRTRML